MRAAVRQDVHAGDWADVTGALASGGVVAHVPAGQAMAMQIAADRPLQPRVVDRSTDGVQVDIVPAVDKPLDLYRYTYWIELRATGRSSARVYLALGGVPRRALARMASPGAAASLTAVDYQGLLRTPDRVSEVLVMSRDEQSQLVGTGWSRVDADPGGPFRWMTATEARVLMPLARAGARRIRIQAFREAVGPSSIRLALDGVALPWQPLRSGWQAYEWELPADLALVGPVDAAVIVDALPAPVSGAIPRAVAIAEISLLAR